MAEDEAVAVGGRLVANRDRAVSVDFASGDLPALRQLVDAHARRAGLSRAQCQDAVLAVDEIAANAVRHGGGSGTLSLWPAPGWFCFRVQDSGRGLPPDVAPHLPDPAQPNGRGLWIATHLTDELTIHSGPSGTTITGRFALPR
jgi:anti-sigma regulatory factor (Ser/Thr protein kinase)